ncbi:hypothetical protein Tco_0591479 [Tanacetum coccineum]
MSTSATHNAIMEAGGKDRAPMLVARSYVQWKSRIRRYTATRPNHELINDCINNGPYVYQESEHEDVSDEDDTPRDKEIVKLMALILTSFKKIYKPTSNNLRISSNTKNKNVDNAPRTDRRSGYDRQTGKYENQRAMNVGGNRDTLEEAGIQLSIEQEDWVLDSDEEPTD